jgi:hypothetical protein
MIDRMYPLDAKENYEHALDFALHLSRLFTVSVSSDWPPLWSSG